MAIMNFPTNPDDGMIYEVIPGLFYRYSKASNCWSRLKNLNGLGLATPLTNGLMSKDDFNKLKNIILPPPQISIRSDKCDTPINSGTLTFTSSDDSIEITDKPTLIGNGTKTNKTWQLHHSTGGFDFRLNIDKLIQDIEEKNQLKKVSLIGDKGPKGDIGDPGIDELDTGPIGDDGIDGANSPFDGTLISEQIPFELSSRNVNRAIVDITTEEISDDENYLVITRANIGNPDACPSLVIPKNFSSPLITVINNALGKKIRQDKILSQDDCSLICRVCASSIHHLNIENIVSSIYEQFLLVLLNLKREKEELVKSWLQVMINLFNSQKASLCCALENCMSRNRNQSTRQYIETQRIQAALGNFSLTVSSDPSDRQLTNLDSHKKCEFISIDDDEKFIQRNGNTVTVTLNSKLHIVDPNIPNSNAVKFYMKPGTYTAQIDKCCPNLNTSSNTPAYSGLVGIQYQANETVDDELSVKKQTITFPNFGTFENEEAAQNAYQGVTLTFDHAGGDISLWIIDHDNMTSNNEGEISITISLLVDPLAPSTSPSVITDPVYVYKNEISSDGLLGEIKVFQSNLTASDNINPDGSLNVGPSLSSEKSHLFFFDGLDGLSLFFASGAPPDTFNNQISNIVTKLEITDNTFLTSVKAKTPNVEVTRQNGNNFEIKANVNGDSAIVAIGEFDNNVDYIANLELVDMDTIQELIAASDSDSNVLLAKGGTDGIGSPIVYQNDSTAKLFSVTGIPSEFGGGNQYGLRINSEKHDQTITISRPISIDTNLFGNDNNNLSTTQSDSIDIAPPEDGIDIGFPKPPSLAPPENPPSAPPLPPIPPTFPPPSITSTVDLCEIEENSILDSTEKDAVLSQGDPALNDISVSLRSSAMQNVRYIATDENGNKYYSAYKSIDIDKLNSFQKLSLGPPVKAISPPAGFTDEIIKSKNVDANKFSNLLSNQETTEANNFEGISRLSYIQEKIGSEIQEIPKADKITDIELQFRNVPISSIDIGSISAKIGLPGFSKNVLIDDFKVPSTTVDNLDIGQETITGISKRTVVDTQTTDSKTDGLLPIGLTSYYADYSGIDQTTTEKIELSGNNFYTIDNSTGRIYHINDDNIKPLINLNDNIQTFLTTDNNNIADGNIVVGMYGVVYVVDNTNGQIIAYMSANSDIESSTHGDAHSNGSNIKLTLATGLPKSDNASITIGKINIIDQYIVEQLICNFGGELFIINGIPAGRVNEDTTRNDTNADRCCFGDAPISKTRVIAIPDTNLIDHTPIQIMNNIGAGKIVTDRAAVPQLSLPIPSKYIDDGTRNIIQNDLDNLINNFELYLLNDNNIYKIDTENNVKTLFVELNEPVFGLISHPRTKDLYYIVKNTELPFESGSTIRKIDVDNINPATNTPIISTVYKSDIGNITSITFGNSVPSDQNLKTQVLYAISTTLSSLDKGDIVTVKLVEIAEQLLPPTPPTPLSREIPFNPLWISSTNVSKFTIDNPDKIIFSKIAPGQGCQMFYKQVQWYERGWRIGACCGALVEYGGIWYIVVKRSIGSDTSCGGGESLGNPCIAQFVNSGQGHPAIAWPTIGPSDSIPGGGGEEFLGLPTNGFVTFLKDFTLSLAILDKIRAGDVAKVIGNPADEIPFILFPAT